MPPPRPLPRLLTALVLATGFGSLNALLVHGSANAAAEVAGHVLNAGWAWAGLAVAAGALVGTARLGALAGALAAGVGLGAYYVTDAGVRDVTPATSAAGDGLWAAATVLVCPLLGLAGSRAGRPGAVGLLAALLVPVGALVEVLALPPGPPGPAVTWSRWGVGILAVAAAVLALRAHARRDRTPVGTGIGTGIGVRPAGAPATSGRSPHRPPRRRRR